MRMEAYDSDLDIILGGKALDLFIEGMERGLTVANSLEAACESFMETCDRPARLPDGEGSRVVTFVVDQSNSISMAKRDEAGRHVVAFIDAAARRLEAEGVPFEVIGHTTPKWKGGDTFEAWDEAGRPAPEEGTFWRLNEVLVMVHKAVDEDWGTVGRTRLDATLVRNRDVLKENIDQVALHEAVMRQRRMGADEGTVVLVGDLYPVDDWTIMHGPRRSEAVEQDLARVISEMAYGGARVIGVESRGDGWPETTVDRGERLGIPVLTLPARGDAAGERLAAFVDGEFADLVLSARPVPGIR